MQAARAREFTLRKGLDLPLAGVPEQEVHEGAPVASVAVELADFPGVQPVLDVREGEQVRRGDVLFHDARDPGVRCTAPGAGTVSSVERGARRELRKVVVRLQGEGERRFAACAREELERLPRERVLEQLLESGLWTALRTRPFGHVPLPSARPDALFVRATDTQPLAARPDVVIAALGGDAFAAGLAVLGRLADVPLYLCRGPGAAIPSGDPARVTVAEFAGPHPAGLVGTHVHFLHPVGSRRTVWYVDHQDTSAIGRLFTTGRLPVERIVALGGPAVRRPRLLRTRVGASIDDLVQGELLEGECRVFSGSVLSGRPASGSANHLGRQHAQISVLPRGAGRRAPRFTFYRLPWPRRRRRVALSAAPPDREEALVPLGSFERVVPLRMLATPLLRALLVGDVETAESLGCLELEEEDLALCSYVCPSRIEYGPLLRAALARLERRA